jgi:DNA-binding response OmpR family regulator
MAPLWQRRVTLRGDQMPSEQMEDRAVWYEAGAVDFIQKPIEADILRSKANVFLDLHRQRQQIAAQRGALEAQAATLKAFEQLTRRQLIQEQETASLREQFIAVPAKTCFTFTMPAGE